MKKILGFLIFLFISNSFADGHVIKAKQSMLYFAGLYPNYLLYLQGDIPNNTKDSWVDKDYWAVLEIDKSSKNHGGEAVILKLKKTTSASPQPEWCVTQGGDKWDGKGPACLKTDKPKKRRPRDSRTNEGGALSLWSPPVPRPDKRRTSDTLALLCPGARRSPTRAVYRRGSGERSGQEKQRLWISIKHREPQTLLPKKTDKTENKQ